MYIGYKLSLIPSLLAAFEKKLDKLETLYQQNE